MGGYIEVNGKRRYIDLGPKIRTRPSGARPTSGIAQYSNAEVKGTTTIPNQHRIEAELTTTSSVKPTTTTTSIPVPLSTTTTTAGFREGVKKAVNALEERRRQYKEMEEY